MSQTATGSFESDTQGGWKKKVRWSGAEIVAMIAGFIVFWPLGLLALFVKFKNGEMWKGAREGEMPWSGIKVPSFDDLKAKSYGYSSSGNAAFDEYKRTQLARLEEERRKLDDEQKAFREHLDRLRKAKDQDEFDRFMAERNQPSQS
jgi:Protein of unknown function (DUF2852)